VKNKIYSFAAAALLAALPLNAAAQDITREAEKPAEAVAAQAEAAQTAQAARAKTAEESAEVTYAQVLERPDDAALNLAYAKTQVRRGDLKGAAATLERMLMVNENLHSIRLFYAVVLLRLDNTTEAERELETIARGQASAEVKKEAASYAETLRKSRRLFAVSGSLSAGGQYDSNRNAAPTSSQRLFMDNPLQLTGLSKRRDDASLIFVGSADLRRALGRQREHQLNTGFSYFRADQDSVTGVNLQAASLRAGGAFKHGAYTLKPGISYDRVKLSGEDFLAASGAAFRAERPLDRRTELSAEARYSYQDHLRSDNIASNPERRGPMFAVSAGGARVLNPVMRLSAELGFTRKQAAKKYNSYSGGALTLRHSWLLGKGRFLLSSLSLANDLYSKPDPMISRRTRRDASARLSLTASTPLDALHPRLAQLKDLNLSLSLEHFASRSTLTNYTYENNKASVLLNYKWDLGL
jgi:hypothetical protein